MVDLDDQIRPGTHWVAMNIKPDVIEYFDSLGLNCLTEVVQLSDKLLL